VCIAYVKDLGANPTRIYAILFRTGNCLLLFDAERPNQSPLLVSIPQLEGGRFQELPTFTVIKCSEGLSLP
jgi:hypothetical protein